MGELDSKMLTTFLLTVFLFVMVVAGVFIFMVLHARRHRTLFGLAGADKGISPASPLYHPHFALKRPAAWLAIKNRDLSAVQSALALDNPKRCSWTEGLAGDGDQKLFVSPPVSGWILVIGSALPDANDDVDACFRFLLDLSRKLGHVQFFSADTVLNHHAWVQVESGRVVRAYAWAGKTLWNQGKPTPAENELAMKCCAYAETPEPASFVSSEPISNNSDKVHLLAARWSLDPDEIDERFIDREWGIVGAPSRHL